MQTQSRQVRVGDYVVLGRWATGGMAHVYVARRPSDPDNRLYAIKTLRPEYVSDEHYRDMFATEAHVAALWSHPNVVQTREVVRDRGRLFIVMDFVFGETLRSVIEAAKTLGKFPQVAALEIAERLAHALASAHALRDERGRHLGLIHRDVCPANVLVDYDGSVKLLDFGIAKAALRTQSTQGLQVKGHIAYVSPEQAAGARDLDARTDVYSLGLVLWELLTLRPALTGASDSEILTFAVQGKIPAPSEAGAAVSPALDAIVLRALARDRRERFPSALEFARALEKHRRKNHPRAEAGMNALREFMGRQFADKQAEDRALVANWEHLARTSVPERPAADAAPTQLGGERPRVQGSIPLPTPRAVSDGLESLPFVPPPPPPRDDPSRSMGALLNRSTSIPVPPESLDVEVPTRLRERVLLLSTVVLAFALAFSVGLLIARGRDRVLRVESDPTGAEVFVDGRLVGRSPLEVAVARDTPVNVVLQLEGYDMVHLAIGKGSESLAVTGKLDKSAPGSQGMCKTPLKPPMLGAVDAGKGSSEGKAAEQAGRPAEQAGKAAEQAAKAAIADIDRPQRAPDPPIGAPVPKMVVPVRVDQEVTATRGARSERAERSDRGARASSKRDSSRGTPKALTIPFNDLDTRPSLSARAHRASEPAPRGGAKPSSSLDPAGAPLTLKDTDSLSTRPSLEPRGGATAPSGGAPGGMIVEVGRATVIGRIDQNALERTLTSAAGPLRACYASEVNGGTPFSGKLRMQLGIDTEGKADSVTTNMLGSKAFRSCVESAMARLVLPKAEGDRALVFVPVRLEAL